MPPCHDWAFVKIRRQLLGNAIRGLKRPAR
jgi:hypothetical protein